MLRALAVVVLAGCGPTASLDFAGTYAGHVRVAGTCSDGKPFTDGREWPDGNGAGNAEWVLTNTDGGLAVYLGPTEFAAVVEGSCGVLWADVGVGGARVRRQTCPDIGTDGTSLITTFTGGTLTPEANALVVELNSYVVASGTTNGNCSVTESGTLQRPDGGR